MTERRITLNQQIAELERREREDMGMDTPSDWYREYHLAALRAAIRTLKSGRPE